MKLAKPSVIEATETISVCCMNQSLLLLMCQYLHYYQKSYYCYKVYNFMFNSYLCTCRAKIFVKGY